MRSSAARGSAIVMTSASRCSPPACAIPSNTASSRPRPRAELIVNVSRVTPAAFAPCPARARDALALAQRARCRLDHAVARLGGSGATGRAHIVARGIGLPCFRHIDYTYCISNSQARYRASPCRIVLIIALSLHVLSSCFGPLELHLGADRGPRWRKALVRRSGGDGRDRDRRTLWRLVHEGSFALSEKILAAGAITALAAIAVQIIIGGGAVRQCATAQAIRQAPARGWRSRSASRPVFARDHAICNGRGALCVTSILPHQIWRDLLEAADAEQREVAVDLGMQQRDRARHAGFARGTAA